jgi:predicted small metal-binding protein
MTNENVEKANADQSDSELELKAEEDYREFLCREEYNGKECGFRVRAKTDDEIIELARIHQETAHGIKADAKKLVSEIGNIMSRAKADVEKVKANLGHKADATRILVTDADIGARSDSQKKKADAKGYAEDARDTVESTFGVNSGIVWKALNQNSPMTIDDIVKATALNPEEIYGALGWLGRENKISLETRGKVRLFSLRS